MTTRGTARRTRTAGAAHGARPRHQVGPSPAQGREGETRGTADPRKATPGTVAAIEHVMMLERMAITGAAGAPGRSLATDVKDDLAQLSRAGTPTVGLAPRERRPLPASRAIGAWHLR
eukprot:12397950-Alexandrium_andersonii.AAC.1